MSDRLSPGPDVKARFQALAEKEFLTFFEEIPTPAIQGVAQYLPSVDGFRKTSLAGIAKQKAALARKLTKANANDRDFNGLYLIWRTWIDANFENPKTIHKLMDKLEEAADRQVSAEARRLTIEQHVDAFLQKLKDESLQNHCTREQIERLFTFSPLPETPAARVIIAAAKSATEVDRDATLSELPKRLQLDEDEIERIKSELKLQSGRLDQISASVEVFRANLDDVNASVAEARLSGQNAQAAVETLVKVSRTQDESPKPSAPDNSEMDMRIEALAIAVESRRDEIRTLASKLADLDTLLSAVAEVDGAQKTNQETLLTLDRRVAEVGPALDQVKRDFAEHGLTLGEQLGAIQTRLCHLEQRPSVSMLPPVPAYETKALTARRYQEPQRGFDLRWDSLIAPDKTDERILQSHTELSRALAATLGSENPPLRRSAKNAPPP